MMDNINDIHTKDGRICINGTSVKTRMEPHTMGKAHQRQFRHQWQVKKLKHRWQIKQRLQSHWQDRGPRRSWIKATWIIGVGGFRYRCRSAVHVTNLLCSCWWEPWRGSASRSTGTVLAGYINRCLFFRNSLNMKLVVHLLSANGTYW